MIYDAKKKKKKTNKTSKKSNGLQLNWLTFFNDLSRKVLQRGGNNTASEC